MPFSRKFSIISDLKHIEIIARGTGVDVRRHLNQMYGRGRWRKLKGRAWVQYENGRTVYAEIHWFEAHGIGKVGMKIVQEFNTEE